jgi:hypothetical protein
MRHTCRYWQTLGRIALLFVMAALFAKSSFAQKDLQILVSGPWAYVTDPAKHPGRLFLVAPNSQHHMVYIFGGINASDFANQHAIGVGSYTLDFDPNIKGTYTAVDQEPAVLCGGAIADPNRLQIVLASTTNYVISLPTPDGYSTYADPTFKSDGYSESKVSSGHFTTSVFPENYTTLMVLHYGIRVMPDSLMQAGTKTDTVKTTDATGNSAGGISIVVGDPEPKHNDSTCDHVSLESVKERNGLWNLTQYARFPKELNMQGLQDHYHYDYARCSDTDPTVHPLSKNSGDRVGLLSTGSADCHTCQMSINSAIPGAIVPTTVGIQ